ncbi:MAG: succinate dehydrogenase, hydrophobic membrane anchor protein [Candidatus Pelagibacter sp.]|nr:succinate dehydrogenase, hydrophobic membrane anchor protein [Candidatus Pelagibacter sp.]|tara:strand:- start:2809 stop:3138 length:330 start_codon:yes stop_codon:yes gene_type:complete
MIRSVNKWIIYRFSSLILTPIVFWLVVNMPKNIFVNQNTVENFINDNLNFSVLVIAYLLISVNIKIGINEVFEDYIHNEFYKNVAKWVISVLIIVISFLAIISMLIIRL